MVKAETDKVVIKRSSAGSLREKEFKDRYAQVETISELNAVIDDSITKGRRLAGERSLLELYQATADILPARVPDHVTIIATNAARSTDADPDIQRKNQEMGTKAFIFIYLPLIFRHIRPNFTADTHANEEYFQDVLLRVGNGARHFDEQRITSDVTNATKRVKKSQQMSHNIDDLWDTRSKSSSIIAAIDEMAIDHGMKIGEPLTQKEISATAVELAEKTGYEYDEVKSLTTARTEQIYGAWPLTSKRPPSEQEKTRNDQVNQALKAYTLRQGINVIRLLDDRIMKLRRDNPIASLADIVQAVIPDTQFAFTEEQLTTIIGLRMSQLDTSTSPLEQARQRRKEVPNIIVALGKENNPITRDEKIIQSVFNLDGGGIDTMENLAKQFGLGRQRVSQLIKKVFNNFKENYPHLEEYI